MKEKSVIQRIAGGGLRITALEIRNLWGIAEAVIRPGSRNIIRGANGTGKSALLNAIQIALGGGSLGKYQRIGAEEPPEIVLEISSSSDFVRVERQGDKSPRVLRRVGNSEALEKVSAPAAFLKGLFDVRGANPFAFLGASDDERAQLLLEALDVTMDETALGELLGKDETLVSGIPATLHPLVRLDLIHDAIYSARRGANVDADGKQKAAEQLKRSVPHERLPDVSAEVAALDAEIHARGAEIARAEEANDAEAEAAIQSAESSFREEKNLLTATLEHMASELRAETERRIAEAEKETAAKVEEIWHTTAVASEIARGLREAQQKKTEVHREALAADRERLARLREQAAEATRHENTREQIAQFQEAAEKHGAESARLTAVLRGIEGLKRQLAEKLPIDGLDISGREIKVNGVRWQDLNKGQQGGIAGVVAVERAKHSRLPVVFFDQAELFDEVHIDAISSVVEAAGGQLFVAVVAREGEIKITADGELGGTVRVDAPADPLISHRKE